MIACIPSIGLSYRLPALLDVLEAEPVVTRILVVDNSEDQNAYPFIEPYNVEYVHNFGETIYQGWNRGIAIGHETGENVALLNDDIILPAGSLAVADQKMTGKVMLVGLNYFEPQRTVRYGAGVRRVFGTYRTTGFGGFAFVVRHDSPMVNEGFRWWYGDDDLAQRIIDVGGTLVIANGAPVDHPVASVSGNQMPWLPEAIASDVRLFKELWPNLTTG